MMFHMMFGCLFIDPW